ncbi:MAG: phenylalanine--tRNA ligase beta subunit-related protein [Acidilobaceae archaeon]
MTDSSSFPYGEKIDARSLIKLDEGVVEIGVRIAYAIAMKSSKSGSSRCLDEEIEKLVEQIMNTYDLESLKDNTVIKAYRSFYWRLGIDPTKVRPSSEALVRRVLKNKRFPRVNTVVDAGNVASAKTLVPIGIYDLDKATLPLTFKLSRGGEVFESIGGFSELLPPGVPILVDSSNTVMHLYPHRDSVKTAVDESTVRVLIIGAGVPGVSTELLVNAVDITITLLESCGWTRLSETLTKP